MPTHECKPLTHSKITINVPVGYVVLATDRKPLKGEYYQAFDMQGGLLYSQPAQSNGDVKQHSLPPENYVIFRKLGPSYLFTPTGEVRSACKGDFYRVATDGDMMQWPYETPSALGREIYVRTELP